MVRSALAAAANRASDTARASLQSPPSRSSLASVPIPRLSPSKRRSPGKASSSGSVVSDADSTASRDSLASIKSPKLRAMVRAAVAVWLCGCVAVWLCGCVAVWLCLLPPAALCSPAMAQLQIAAARARNQQRQDQEVVRVKAAENHATALPAIVDHVHSLYRKRASLPLDTVVDSLHKTWSQQHGLVSKGACAVAPWELQLWQSSCQHACGVAVTVPAGTLRKYLDEIQRVVPAWLQRSQLSSGEVFLCRRKPFMRASQVRDALDAHFSAQLDLGGEAHI